jgi:hypothetical protein
VQRCRGAGAGARAGDAGERGHGEKGSGSFAILSRGGGERRRGAERSRVAAGGRKGKLTGGARSSAAPGEGEGACGGAAVGGLGRVGRAWKGGRGKKVSGAGPRSWEKLGVTGAGWLACGLWAKRGLGGIRV